MEKISLSNIAETLAAKNGMTREAASNFMHAFVKTIEKGLQENGMVKVKGLGTFKLLEVSERSSVDVNTGERILIKGYRKVTFTPDSAMKEFVNRPFAHFEPTELNDGYPDDEPIVGDDMDDVEEMVAVDSPVEVKVEEISVETPITEEPVAGEPSVDEPIAEEVVMEESEVATEEVNIQPSELSESVESSEISNSSEIAPLEEKNSLEEPKKEDCQSSELLPKTKKKSKKRRAILWGMLFVALVAGVGLYYYTPMCDRATNCGTTAAVSDPTSCNMAEGASDIVVNPNLGEELAEELGYVPEMEALSVSAEKDTALTEPEKMSDSLAASSQSIAEVSDTLIIIESLLARNLKEITLADTTDYVIGGTLAVHKLKSGETIIQLANKYYGEKRLWPYIVEYNHMERFNSVAIGQEILIPRLRNK